MTQSFSQNNNNEIVIEVKNLTKSFGKKVVLDNLSFSIPRGKISYIIGRSGEGKSVTIKHLVGILQANSGKIIIKNQEMNYENHKQWNEMRKKIGILFQDGALFDSMSIFENVSFPIVNHIDVNKKQLKEKVEYLLESVGLPDSTYKYPPELSIGERKRVGLARALALDPEIIFYDEPTTGMDPLISDLIDNLIVDTQKNFSNLTSIVISHDITSVMNTADNVFLLHNGKIYLEGAPSDFTQSKDALVIQFLTGGLKGPLEVPLI